jgi:hypothetical protein
MFLGGQKPLSSLHSCSSMPRPAAIAITSKGAPLGWRGLSNAVIGPGTNLDRLVEGYSTIPEHATPLRAKAKNSGHERGYIITSISTSRSSFFLDYRIFFTRSTPTLPPSTMSISVDDLVASFNSSHIGQEQMDLAALQVLPPSSSIFNTSLF